jgi:DNA-binding NarL/FixJ family response regulator
VSQPDHQPDQPDHQPDRQRDEQRRQPDQPDHQPDRSAGLPVRVLIVDDQPPFRLAAAAVLDSMAGFTVVGTAETGEEAVALAASLSPQLVLMDVVLPQMSGLETTRLLRQRAPAPVVVLVSTYDAGEFGEDVEQSGAEAYLTKSAFDSERLEAIWLAHRS